MCPSFEKNPNSCPSVGWLFKGVQGLNVHISCAHKAEHLVGLEAKTSQSAPIQNWSNEEIRFLAHAEFERRRDMVAMMALERSLEALPNTKMPKDKDLCSLPLLRYHLSILTKI